jgi:hypothetical protein
MAAKIFEYADPRWRVESFTCAACGWSGPSDAMNPEYFDALKDFSCPRYDAMILIISYPRSDGDRAAPHRSGPETNHQKPAGRKTE